MERGWKLGTLSGLLRNLRESLKHHREPRFACLRWLGKKHKQKSQMEVFHGDKSHGIEYIKKSPKETHPRKDDRDSPPLDTLDYIVNCYDFRDQW